MNSTPIKQKTIVEKCFIIYANRMIYLSCIILLRVNYVQMLRAQCTCGPFPLTSLQFYLLNVLQKVYKSILGKEERLRAMKTEWHTKLV